jgi:hypothetical protein
MDMIPGRALVIAEEGQIEYFYRYERSGKYIRTFCGGLRPASICRPLDYVCSIKYLKYLGPKEVNNDLY